MCQQSVTVPLLSTHGLSQSWLVDHFGGFLHAAPVDAAVPGILGDIFVLFSRAAIFLVSSTAWKTCLVGKE